jgi:carotenoid cleavage dioxygenase
MSLRRRDFLRSSTAGILGGLGAGHLLAKSPQPSLGESKNPFLMGNFAPVRDEVTVDNLKVLGKLPPELDGMYVRNGPNPQFPPRGAYHWFDGDGMLHGVRLQAGKASYRNRYVQTAGWKEERQAGKALWGSITELPDPQRLLEGHPFKNAANTALVWHHGRLLALWEGGEPTVLDAPELSTRGLETFGGRLKHPFTAHPKIDPVTGEMLFFGYQPLAPYLQFSICDRSGKITRTVPVEIPRPVMMHDFAITPNYAVFLDLPETFDLTRMLKGEPLLKFEPELGARIGLLARNGKPTVQWFTVQPCFIFHTLNAYEEGEEVVLLACRMKEYPAFLDAAAGDPSQQSPESRPVLYRYVLNTKTGEAREQAVDDASCEFPRLNDSLIGRKSRFGYTMSGEMSGLLKYDLTKGTYERNAHGRGRLGGEGVFVPRPGSKSEDDGWLVTYVHDEAEGRSEMVLLEAGDFRAPPIARVLLPQRVPYGFHGAWLPGEVLLKKS